MSRSRSGCLTCKRRHRKCDETRPDCLQCLGQGIECEGYNVVLRWDTGIASRGRLTGAPTPADAPPAKRRRTIPSPRSSSGDSPKGNPPEANSVTLSEREPSRSKDKFHRPIPSALPPNPEPSGRPPKVSQPSPQHSEPSPAGSPWPGQTDQDRNLYEQCACLPLNVPESKIDEFYMSEGSWTNRYQSTILPSFCCIPPTAMTSSAVRLVAAIDALCDTRTRPEYSHLLTTNSLLYPYVAARLEVATLQQRPSWMDVLRRAVDVCQPYGRSANACNIAEMLDEAWKAGDDDYDIDEHARRRNVEIALF
ncbi:C6 finger domain-containing protein [Colletotrichum kahawae]|uniref:C6 finger domain-containing protein n=1 Tax=Colletotrichum kahawae TaxID=34407 RepID=A0AAD9XYG8_COLKA|nr:C6 finger domain-containing protein [Colletotrichum kahawae]